MVSYPRISVRGWAGVKAASRVAISEHNWWREVRRGCKGEGTGEEDARLQWGW